MRVFKRRKRNKLTVRYQTLIQRWCNVVLILEIFKASTWCYQLRDDMQIDIQILVASNYFTLFMSIAKITLV